MRFNNFDSFLGTSLEGLEDQATEFLLAVEQESMWLKKFRGERFKRVEGIVQLY